MSDEPKWLIVPEHAVDYRRLDAAAPPPPDIVGALEEAREIVARNAALDLHPTMAGKLEGILYRIDAALDQWYGRNGGES